MSKTDFNVAFPVNIMLHVTNRLSQELLCESLCARWGHISSGPCWVSVTPRFMFRNISVHESWRINFTSHKEVNIALDNAWPLL